MNASNWYIEGSVCPVCGVKFSDEVYCGDESYTIDHIYPKSAMVSAPHQYQMMCRRCNQLKGAHSPSAFLMYLLRAMRTIERVCGANVFKSISVDTASNKLYSTAKATTIFGGSISMHSGGTAVPTVSSLGVCDYNIAILLQRLMQLSPVLSMEVFGEDNLDATIQENIEHKLSKMVRLAELQDRVISDGNAMLDDCIRVHPEFLDLIPNPPYEMCLDVVKKEPRALKYIEHQDVIMCMAAVRQDGMALEFVKDKTIPICMVAVRNTADAVQFVERDQLPKLLRALFKYSK